MTDFEIQEAHYAYHEWDDLREARKKFDKENDSRTGEKFSQEDYIEEREDAILRGDDQE